MKEKWLKVITCGSNMPNDQYTFLQIINILNYQFDTLIGF